MRAADADARRRPASRRLPRADARPRARRGRGRRHRRVVSRRGRARGHGRRPAAGAGARDIVRQRRPDLGVARRAVGEPGRAAQDPAMAGARGCAAAVPPARRSASMGVRARLPARVPAMAHAAQHDRSASISRSIRATACKSLRAATGIVYDQQERGILEFYTDAREFDAGAKAAGADARARRRSRGEDGRRMRRDRAGARRLPRAPRRRHLHARPTSRATPAASPRSSRASPRRAASGSAGAYRRRACRGRRRDHRRALHATRDAGTRDFCPPTRTSSRSRAISPFVLRPLVRALPGLSGEGLFGDDRDRRSSRRADGVAHRCRREDRDDASRASGCASRAPRNSPGYGTDFNAGPLRGAACSRIFELFPDAGERDSAQFWTGLRPATPSNVPLVGATRYRNLFLDTGHGTLGWTMACGSGRALADIIGGREPQVEFAFYARRLRSGFPSLGRIRALGESSPKPDDCSHPSTAGRPPRSISACRR